MLEVEVKYRNADRAAAVATLLEWGATLDQDRTDVDLYFQAPDRDLKAGTAAGKKSTGQDKQGYLEKNKDQGTLGAEKPVEEKREALRLNRARTNPEPGEVGKVAATGEAGPAEAESVGKNAPQEAAREEKSSDEGTRQRADAAVPAVPAPQAWTAPPATSDELQAQSPYDALMQRLGIDRRCEDRVIR